MSYMSDQNVAPRNVQRVWSGVIAKSATLPSDFIHVIIPSLDANLRWTDVRWQAKDNVSLPQRDDECLVALDDKDEMWVVTWWSDPRTPWTRNSLYSDGAPTNKVDNDIWVAENVNSTAKRVEYQYDEPTNTWIPISLVPLPVQNGQWLKGSGGAVTWASIARSDLPPEMYVPAGTGAIWFASTAPSGWALLDGSTLVNAQTVYPILWANVDSTWKSGSNIILPNLKGKIPVGFDSGQTEFNVMGKTGGEKTHLLTSAEMPTHDHGYDGVAYGWPAGQGFWNSAAGDIKTVSTARTGVAGSSTAHNNLQPYVTINWIIKLT